MSDVYVALTQGAGFLERTDRGRLRLTGADRKSYLQGLLTNDIVGLRPGSGCYAAMLTAQGRMIADMRVLDIDEAVLLDVDASLASMLRERFDQFIFSEDVAVSDISDSTAQLSVVGPLASRTIAVALAARGVPSNRREEVLQSRLSELHPFQVSWVHWQGPLETPMTVAANDDLGVPGFDLYLPRETAGVVTDALRAAGAVPAGAAALEVLRVEAGRPAFLKDMDADTIPLEAGIEGRAISHTKGCYVGQEIIIRVLHRGGGRVARKLVGLLVDDAVPSPGDGLRAGDREIGRVTSAVLSPALGRPVALGYAHRDFTTPGTDVQVLRQGTVLNATVAELPFVRRHPGSASPA